MRPSRAARRSPAITDLRIAIAVAVAVAVVVGCKDRERSTPATLARDAAAPPIAGWPELAGLSLAQPDWLVELTPLAPRPSFAIHPPVVVGERVVVAGSRAGYRGLDLSRGAEAWRRPGGAWLSAPLVLTRHDVVLVSECDGAVAAPPGHRVVACFERIDPIAIAARSAGRIYTPDEKVGCVVGGAWTLAGDDPAALTLGRDTCRFALELPSGRAQPRSDAPAPSPVADDVVATDGDAVWRQVIDAGASYVAREAGPRLPGLTVLAAGRVPGRDAGAVVVRVDASLYRDYLAAYDGTGVAWVWPLPSPPPADGGRGGPTAVSADAGNVIVIFDAGRVARFTAPWAPPTAR